MELKREELHSQVDMINEHNRETLDCSFNKLEPKTRAGLTAELRKNGLLVDADPRLSGLRRGLAEICAEPDDPISPEQFKSLWDTSFLMEKAFSGHLVIPGFEDFTRDVERMYNLTLPNKGGKNADYIPQLAKVDPEQFGVAVCTTAGQRYTIGDSQFKFCIQSCSKPLTYCMAQNLTSEGKVCAHVGYEPSGRPFNEVCHGLVCRTVKSLLPVQVCLDTRETDASQRKMAAEISEIRNNSKLTQDEQIEAIYKLKSETKHPASIPHNPLINAGAIMTCSLVKNDCMASERFEYAEAEWNRLCGKGVVGEMGFANSTYLSEAATADRNYCLGYLMQEAGAFPDNVNLKDTLEFYFMLCSMEASAEMMSVVAATLANGGTNPITGDRIYDERIVANCLSLMYSCGMYDNSGEFAFKMGFPAKSGVGGGILTVIPGLMGICTFSPRLDEIGNSVRGVEFFGRLAAEYAFHNYSFKADPATSLDLTRTSSRIMKKNPRLDAFAKRTEAEKVTALLQAACDGENETIIRLLAEGLDVNAVDYDERSALHLASSEGRVDTCRLLVDKAADLTLRDRYSNTPLADAMRPHPVTKCGHADTAQFLVTKMQQMYMPENQCDDEAAGTNASYNTLRGYLEDGRSHLNRLDISSMLENMGFTTNDPRIAPHFDQLSEDIITEDQWCQFIEQCPLVHRIVTGEVVIKDWQKVVDKVTELYNATQDDPKNIEEPGKVADYIPALANTPTPDAWGVAICSVDGQRFAVGDTDTRFCVQSSSKPITYCIGVRDHGAEYMHSHVGCEPSGVPFNEIVLNKRLSGNRGAKGLPHNPLVNAGAIMACAIVKPGASVQERIKYALKTWGDLAGDADAPEVDQEVYEGESSTAYRNHCLAWLMMEAGAFPDGTSQEVMHETLEFYFMCCSITLTAKQLTVVAGSLANSGKCPITGMQIFAADTVQYCLTIMSSCGMYDASGRFCFKMGFPAKSGVGGSLLLVIPNVMGICTWSPKLDGDGNSVRGVSFCEKFAEAFAVHNYESQNSPKLHLTAEHCTHKFTQIGHLCAAAEMNDLKAVKWLVGMYGKHMVTQGDYDSRTPFHLAATEGHVKVVKYFIKQYINVGADLNPLDRWGQSPLDEARKRHEEDPSNNNYAQIVQMLSDLDAISQE